LTTLVVYLAYLVPVLWLYLRPVPVLQVGGERAATTA